MPKEFVDQETGEVIDPEMIEFAYTREGRRVFGRELPNPIPMEPPLGFTNPEPIHEMIARMVRTQVSAAAAAEEQETFEEADDFDIDDDAADPYSPWEEQFEPDMAWPPSKQVSEAETDIVAAQGEVERLTKELAEAQKRAAATPPKVPPEGAPSAQDAKPGA